MPIKADTKKIGGMRAFPHPNKGIFGAKKRVGIPTSDGMMLGKRTLRPFTKPAVMPKAPDLGRGLERAGAAVEKAKGLAPKILADVQKKISTRL